VLLGHREFPLRPPERPPAAQSIFECFAVFARLSLGLSIGRGTRGHGRTRGLLAFSSADGGVDNCRRGPPVARRKSRERWPIAGGATVLTSSCSDVAIQPDSRTRNSRDGEGRRFASEALERWSHTRGFRMEVRRSIMGPFLPLRAFWRPPISGPQNQCGFFVGICLRLWRSIRLQFLRTTHSRCSRYICLPPVHRNRPGLGRNEFKP